MTGLRVDEAEIARFCDALLRYADEATYVALRGFRHAADAPAFLVQGIQINGDRGPLIKAATAAAQRCADAAEPIVFAPPIATMKGPRRARGEDLANGVALSVEIDDVDPEGARIKLESILGPCTIAMASGSDWADPATGEIKPNLHLHWRLSEPTRDPADHARLLDARAAATGLIGGDPTAKPAVHPMRWPGTWNRKREPPRMARIVVCNPDAEIHLDAALDALAEAAGTAIARDIRQPTGSPQAAPALVAQAMAAIPNPDVHYDDWIRLGYAAHRATGGAGYAEWEAWSRKSGKFDPANTESAWKRIAAAIAGANPPRQIGAGTIFWEATKAGWTRPMSEPPASETDPGFWESLEQALGSNGPPPEPAPAATQARTGYPATPFDPARLAAIQPRQWVYGHFLIRQYLSLLGGPGGIGKTSYAIAIAISIVLEDNILQERVHQGGSVWIINLEDRLDEIDRRIWAACIAHDIDPAILTNKLYTDTGREKPLVLVRYNENGEPVVMPVFDDLLAELRNRQIALLIVDPAIKTHKVKENSNDDMDTVADQWSRLADAANCALLLLHHFRKGSGGIADADAFRGASALIDAARAAIALAVMTPEEAKGFAIPEAERRFYIRADNAKLNLAPAPAEAVWLKLQNVELPTGDRVQAAVRWEPTSPWDGITFPVAARILRQIERGPSQGERFTASRRGADNSRWAGNIIVKEADKTNTQAQTILNAWISTNVLISSPYRSPASRKEVSGLTIDPGRVSEMERQTATCDEGWAE